MSTPPPGVPELRIDPSAYKAWIGAEPLALTSKEFQLLALLAANTGRVVSRDEISQKVWGGRLAQKSIDMCLSTLRRRLGDSGNAPGHIETVRGVGYRLESAVSVAAPEPPVSGARLRETLTDLIDRMQEHIQARAKELAAPVIEDAQRAAGERVAAADRRLTADRQRWADLEAELRRQIQALERTVDRLRGEHPTAPSSPPIEGTCQ
ncbi:winged helix-turn-helix domain-containing protein [Microbispora sp. RL4-1S]|uniref:Winged helix-turn-helix domain-containing protein n=1 Tax=Microbispora oryzae TaxID=2806554 RepID=A0A941AJ09_9ACTN|nr:winged helix-turn-helix domain-containing protein [Microbispora oryzae]MBP2704457.1 winged helix-turn-helix domain-containing protein [Microbispora oryzae]